MTMRTKGYPFEVPVTGDQTVAGGVILVDQIRNLDWVQRRATLLGRVDAGTIEAIRVLLKTLLQIR